jgi:hypothetical protein
LTTKTNVFVSTIVNRTKKKRLKPYDHEFDNIITDNRNKEHQCLFTTQGKKTIRLGRIISDL